MEEKENLDKLKFVVPQAIQSITDEMPACLKDILGKVNKEQF